MSTSRFYEAKEHSSKDYQGYLMEPFGPIGIICHSANIDFVQQVNSILHEKRLRRQNNNSNPYVHSAGYLRDDYLIQAQFVRFETGEGKVALNQTVRGHDIEAVVFHSRIKNLFHAAVQAVDLINKEHIAFIEVCENRGKFTRLFNRRACRDSKIDTHLCCNNACKGSFPKSGRTIKQNMANAMAITIL